jgi:AcrR family transcriptional regulator
VRVLLLYRRYSRPAKLYALLIARAATKRLRRHRVSGGLEGFLLNMSTQNRLIEATLNAWEQEGGRGLSVRALAKSAGVPASSLYHHFGNLERLSVTTLDHARAEVERWYVTRLDEIGPDVRLCPDALGSLLASVIDDLTMSCRRQVVAWAEGSMLAVTEPLYGAAMAAWRQMWIALGERLCAICTLPTGGDITGDYIAGESILHLMRWRRSVDCAALDESCHAWQRWMVGELAPDGPWRAWAYEQALAAQFHLGEQNATTSRIAESAADVVSEMGIAGLTHRAVAARAGLTLGVVSHQFRTSSALAEAAYEAVYRRNADLGTAAPSFSLAEAVASLSRLEHPGLSFRPMAELMLAASRLPELVDFIPQLRYLRGRSGLSLLKAMLGPEQTISRQDAAVFSSFSIGLAFSSIWLEPAERSRLRYAQFAKLPLLAAILQPRMSEPL